MSLPFVFLSLFFVNFLNISHEKLYASGTQMNDDSLTSTGDYSTHSNVAADEYIPSALDEGNIRSPQRGAAINVAENNEPIASNLSIVSDDGIQERRRVSSSGNIMDAFHLFQRPSENNDHSMNQTKRSIEKALDEETYAIPETAAYIPADCVRGFKECMVGFSDKLGMTSRIIKGLSGVGVGIGTADYMVGGTIWNDKHQAQIILLSMASFAVFGSIERFLKKVQLRDELHLASYVRKEDFLAEKQKTIPTIYTNEEVQEYLKESNQFVLLPSHSAYAMRYFLFNAMCCCESILGVLWAITGGLSGVTTTAGVSGQNLLGFEDMQKYRLLTMIFGATTAVILLLDARRVLLRDHCAEWMKNYDMLVLYFKIIRNIPEETLYERVRPVPQDFYENNIHHEND